MRRKTKNILFIMFDQLRWDYLGCTGHPWLETPNIDRLASKGVRFSRCYVQSPVCGASRMSFYTGRYVHSHGAAWNNFPLKVGEFTLGDHMRENGVDAWLIGKTHMRADLDGMERLGISRRGVIGARVAECGFDVYLRDDGLWGEGPDGFYDEGRSPYNEYLKSKGYSANNPWNENANSGVSEVGDIASGWFLKHANLPANIREEDSETPWLTSRTIEFLESRQDDQPWIAHVSYIKPHWPYIVPAPYHEMYGHNQVKPVIRAAGELENPHPVLEQYQNSSIARAFRREEVRDLAVPAYMGLIKQCDDQMGRLFRHLEESGRMEDTLIVVTSDHGDYLGDHWLGEKDMFHDCSVKVPLIVYDPSPQCDATRGTVCDELVEGIDLAATFIESVGGEVPDHIVEGQSLLPFLRGEQPQDWRQFAISEYDYSATGIAANLGVTPRQARLFMVADKNWKFVHSEAPGHRPMLFDLENDPDELRDLGGAPQYDSLIDSMYRKLGRWARRMSQRTALSDSALLAMRGRSRRKGILLGLYDGSEVDEELVRPITGKARQNFVQPDSSD